MNLKLKAALQTASVFASAIVMALVVNYIGTTVNAETLRSIFVGTLFAALAYMVYQLCLARLEMQKPVTDAFDKK